MSEQDELKTPPAPDVEELEVEVVAAHPALADETSSGRSRRSLLLGALLLLVLAGLLYSDYRLWSQVSELRAQIREANGNFHSLAEQSVDLPLVKEQLLSEIKAVDQRQQNAQSREQQLQSNLNALRSSQDGATGQLENQKQTLLALNARMEQLDAALAKLGNQNPQSSWQLNEVEHWLIQADHRLQWQQDVTTAIALLDQAQQALSLNPQPGYQPLLAALAQDKAALQALPKLDRSAILQSLSGLLGRLEQLPLRPLIETSVDETPTDNQALNSAWHVFSRDWLVIRKRTPDALPWRSPELLTYLRMNLALSLQLAQQAALQANQPLFERYLLQAETWLSTQVQTKDPEVSRFLAELKSVRSNPVRLSLPDLSHSREQLSLLLAGRLPPKEANP